MKSIISLLSLILFSTQAYSQFTNYRVDNGAYQPEEVSITIDPTNPLRLAAGSNLNYYYYSTNGGLNWTTGTLTSSLYGVWGDPVLRYDALGNLYYSHLSNPPSGGYWIDRIVVQKSTNGGQSWNQGVGVGYNPPVKQQDKEWLGIDMTQSSNRHNIYMSWTEFDRYPSNGISYPYEKSRILFAKSTNQGDSWSETITVSDVEGNCWDDDSTVEGAVPAVGPNGEVYVSWSGPLGIMFDKSTDGGVTFGQDIFVTDQPGGWAQDIPGIYRCNGMPVTGCDVSESPYRGRVYVMWSDQRNGATNTDVFIKKSTDAGNTWFGMTRVNNDTTQRHQFFPWMAIDPVTGFVYVVFYDRRETTGNYTDVYMAVSRNGGDTFENFKISESSFSPLASEFFGDYIDVAAYNRKVHPIWMRMPGTSLSVWTMIYEDTVQVINIDAGQEPPKKIALKQNYPNPFNPSTTIEFEIPAREFVTLKIFNALGQEVAEPVHSDLTPGRYTVPWNASGLASGVYVYRLRAGQQTMTRKMVLLR